MMRLLLRPRHWCYSVLRCIVFFNWTYPGATAYGVSFVTWTLGTVGRIGRVGVSARTEQRGMPLLRPFNKTMENVRESVAPGTLR